MLKLNASDRRIHKIPIIRLRQSSLPLRRTYPLRELRLLSDSIRSSGILQPVIVRKTSSSEYEIIDGERRLRAAVMCGMKTLPCIIADATREQAVMDSLISNAGRAQTDMFEEAECCQYLINTLGLTIRELSCESGISAESIRENLELLSLEEGDREIIRSFGLTKGHALAAVRIENPADRRTALSEIIEKGLNVFQSNLLVEEIRQERKIKKQKSQRNRPVLKNPRIVENTLDRAVEAMRLSGLEPITEQRETESFFEYTIRLKKPSFKKTDVKTA